MCICAHACASLAVCALQLMLGWLRPRPLLVVGFVGVLCAALGYVALSGVSATAFQAVAYMVIKPFFPALVATNMKSSIDKGWETGTTLDAIMVSSLHKVVHVQAAYMHAPRARPS